MQFLDRQRLITSASPHASIVSWMYMRYKGMSLLASLNAQPAQFIVDLIDSLINVRTVDMVSFIYKYQFARDRYSGWPQAGLDCWMHGRPVLSVAEVPRLSACCTDMSPRPDFSPAMQQSSVWKYRSVAGPSQDAAEPRAHSSEARAAEASIAGSKGASKGGLLSWTSLIS